MRTEQNWIGGPPTPAATDASAQATRLAINRLHDAGVLREITGKGRLRRWAAVDLFVLIDRLESAVR